jgi:hypothetical protein
MLSSPKIIFSYIYITNRPLLLLLHSFLPYLEREFPLRLRPTLLLGRTGSLVIDSSSMHIDSASP